MTTATPAPPRPWSRYFAHRVQHRPVSASASLPHAGRFRDLVERFGGIVSEPTPDNPMQSAPYVLFGAYTMGERDTTEAPDDGSPFVVATFCEGDVTVERYRTKEARDRALWLLERAA